MIALNQAGLCNDLLSAFPPDVVNDLRSVMQRVEWKAGTALFTAGSPLQYAYFPVTAVISLFAQLQDGAGAEIAVVGREGIVGVGTFLGSGTAITSAVVQRSGVALRISARDVDGLARNGHVMPHLLRYTQALFSNMAQTSACHSNHSLYQQLCSWLLQHLERQEEADLYITQERISGMLSTRRESITECALKLQRKGVIRYQRGLIKVVDKRMLEQECCKCYEVVRRSLARLRSDQHQHAAKAAPMVSAPHAAAARGRGLCGATQVGEVRGRLHIRAGLLPSA